MLAVYIVVGVVLFTLAIIGAFLGTGYLLKRKDKGDLERYLRRNDCRWEQVSATADDPSASVLFKNGEPEESGIEMRVYYIAQVPAGAEDEGVCLSIIDPGRSNGMILNGFGRTLDAMQFGDGLWHDRFLGDVGIMERVITEKRVEWDQLQREVIIGHYSLCM